MWVRPNEPSRQQHQRHSRLCRCMQHLSNVLNHFWKRWRNEYLIKLQNSHRFHNQNDTIKTVSVGDVVAVHEEDQPRGKWRVAKILDLIVGSDGCTTGALVQVRNKGGKCTKLRRPVQRLYPLEMQCEVPVQHKTKASSSQNPDPVSTEVRTEQPVSTRNCPRQAVAVEADRRRKTWLKDLA